MLHHTKAQEEEDTSGMDMEEEPRRWEEMQADCLVNIFRRLALGDLTFAIPFVCKSWWRASLDPSCSRRLDFRSLYLHPSFMRFAVHRSRGSAEEFAFPLCFAAPSIQDIDYVSIKCPGLKSLTLPGNLMLVDDLRIPELVGRWRDLEHLEMWWKPSSFLEVIAEIGRNCARFTCLKVGGLTEPEDAKAIARWLPELKHLELRVFYLTKDDLEVIINGCRNLESLTLEDFLGIEGDDEVLLLAPRIKRFQYKTSSLPDFFRDVPNESDEQTGTFYWGRRCSSGA